MLIFKELIITQCFYAKTLYQTVTKSSKVLKTIIYA